MNPIVGIGELLWDMYPDGRKVAGGAPFNFTFHCHQLGHPAVIVSRVGDDDLGRELRKEVCRLGLSDEFIQIDPEHPTGTVLVTLDEHKVPTYTITENVAWDFIEWNEHLQQLARQSWAVCYGTLAWRANFEPLDRLITQHRLSAHPPCVVFDVNLRQQYYEAGILDAGAERCTMLKLSEEDHLELVAHYHTRPTDPFEMARCLAQEPQEDFTIFVSRGADGCEVLSGGKRFSEPGVPARVVDTVGAGDAFTAAMVCLHLEGRPLRECARFANHYAARVCEHQGATPRIDRAEVERAAFGSP